MRNYMNISFTDGVRAAQARAGVRDLADRMAEVDVEDDRLGPREASFISERDGFYVATVGEGGWPYVQYRGGPSGFLQVIDDRTLAFADFRGNRQYITVGNLTHDDRVSLFLMDYARRKRLKVLARSRVIERDEDPDLVARLAHPSYPATVERAIVFDVVAYDWNCPQHITPRFTAEEFAREHSSDA